MGHLCGAPNQTRPGTCRRRVRFGRCWQHRWSAFSAWTPSPARPLRSPPRRSSRRPLPSTWRPTPAQSAAAATLLADLLTGGIKATLADRVVNYLGWSGRIRLRARRWRALDCRLLAQTARAVLDLKQRLHEVTGEAVSRLLPRDTPRFHRLLVRKIAERVPLPPAGSVRLPVDARRLGREGTSKALRPRPPRCDLAGSERPNTPAGRWQPVTTHRDPPRVRVGLAQLQDLPGGLLQP